MNLLLEQTRFVVDAVDRIVNVIDHDPVSPTWGCAHSAYWRDKTSEFADMRRQEVMFPLAMLYAGDFPDSRWQGDVRLKRTVEALLSFWCRNQYPDGSLDEWYKGERAFAAAAFSTHAVARTIDLLKGRLAPEIERTARDRLFTTAQWLTRHDDLFKANHQAVGVCALAWAGAVLNESRFTRNAREKLASVVSVQTEEGWFPEIGHMDAGYVFLLVEFIVMAMKKWNDWTHLPVFVKAFDFACEWVHPDLTIGNEYGICHNPYLSPVAAVLLSGHSGRAGYIRQQLRGPGSGLSHRPSPLLTDDLRLLRWAFQPLLAWEYDRECPPDPSCRCVPVPLADSGDDTIRIYPLSGLARFTRQGRTGVFAGAAGGLLRLFGEKPGEAVTDYGYAVRRADGYATNLTFNPGLEIQETDDGFKITCPLAPVRKFMPSFLSRLILRLACSTATGSRMTRRAIDIIRKRKGTAINQSSFNLKDKSGTADKLERTITFTDDGLRIRDRILLQKQAEPGNVFFVGSTDNGWPELNAVIDAVPVKKGPLTCMTIEKTYVYKGQWTTTAELIV